MFEHWILIAIIAVLTYASRVIGIELMAGRKLNATVRMYLNHVPIAIMVVLILKQMVTPSDGQLVLSVPVLASCLATILVMNRFKSFLPSFAVGIAVGICVRYWLG